MKLGNYISVYDELNSNLEFSSIDDLQGINNDKIFQECKSNKNDIDLSRYRICRHGMFAYNKATSRNGEKISIAYRDGKDCLVSPSYFCFSIKDENVLMHEYLMLFFKRPMFDKYVRFHSWGSATEFFDYTDMENVEIDIPDINYQKDLVQKYNVIQKRVEEIEEECNGLERLLLSYYEYLDKPIEGILNDICDKIASGKRPDRIQKNNDRLFNVPVIGASGVTGYTDSKLINYSVISTGRVGTIGKIMYWEGDNWFTDNSLIITSKYLGTIYCCLKMYDFDEIIGGSSNPKITQTDLSNLAFAFPSEEDMKSFEERAKKILHLLFQLNKEKELILLLASSLWK